MAEPTSTTAVAVTAAGLTLFGVATGLHPPLLITGLAGGLWAQFYTAEMHFAKRLASIIMASLVAAWAAPAVAYGLPAIPWWPKVIPADLIQFPAALFLGLLSHALGSLAIKIATAKAEGFAK